MKSLNRSPGTIRGPMPLQSQAQDRIGEEENSIEKNILFGLKNWVKNWFVSLFSRYETVWIYFQFKTRIEKRRNVGISFQKDCLGYSEQQKPNGDPHTSCSQSRVINIQTLSHPPHDWNGSFYTMRIKVFLFEWSILIRLGQNRVCMPVRPLCL